ncbi:MAG TPA: hypothetical protein VI854_02860, partial [Acidimicrobiia bacterium]|nr:hypothetical protein [Acidimicrobiia bacterium]
MGKSSRKKASRPTSRRRSGALGFSVVIAAIVVLGVAGIVASRDDNDSTTQSGVQIGDHWHAAFGVNICGEWQPNPPEYEAATGVHSHGDGFIHLHPFSRAGAGSNATVGLYMKQAGEKISATNIELLGGIKQRNGDKCANLGDKPGTIRWSVNGEEKQGDPGDYVPNDGDVVAIAFLPEGEEIGVPPVARGGQGPTDVPIAPEMPAPVTPEP